jgi:hypothetical protein
MLMAMPLPASTALGDNERGPYIEPLQAEGHQEAYKSFLYCLVPTTVASAIVFQID